MKNIVILGSTGSIGSSALEVVRQYKDRFRVLGLSARCNIDRLGEQIKEFKPAYVAVEDEAKAAALKQRVSGRTKVLSSREGISALAALKDADVVLLAIVGSDALHPLLSALEAAKTVALANKESIVVAGPLVRRALQRHGGRIIPVDSEQSAIFQCLEGHPKSGVECVYLTASGGPLLKYSPAAFKRVALKDVLAHPRWKMGPKITVDSATLMNKGLEVIEAQHLFDLKLDQVRVVVHPQALVHSMVAFVDGSILAQVGVTDMRLPIQVALTYPDRWPNPRLRLDPLTMGPLDFLKPDVKRFRCLALAYEAARIGGLAPCALNAANEVAVRAFLNGEIPFASIPSVIEKVMARGCFDDDVLTPETIAEMDAWARAKAATLLRDNGRRQGSR